MCHHSPLWASPLDPGALVEIDEWDADDDLLELGGDLDEEVVISRVKHRFITAKGLPPF